MTKELQEMSEHLHEMAKEQQEIRELKVFAKVALKRNTEWIKKMGFRQFFEGKNYEKKCFNYNFGRNCGSYDFLWR